MSTINKISNTGTLTFNGATIVSNIVDTFVLTAPTIIKSVDKVTASVGEILTYTFVITNTALTAITNINFTDALPAGTAYKDASFTENGITKTPTITGNTVGYGIANIPVGGISTLSFKATITG